MLKHTTSLAALAVATLALPVAVHAADAPAAAEPAAAPSADSENEVVVTGTRAVGISAANSAAPVKVLDSELIEHVGQPNLNQVLTQLVPSFVAQAFGGDTANLTLSARLRGLSPNHTLVLINGKRRHGTSNLAVLGGPFQGAATADLDLISPSSIKRIEVLEQGAAAQYGSDAIAGVINIILKDDDTGGSGSATAGQNYSVGGDTYAATLHLATKIGEDGFFNLTGFHRFHDYTVVGGLDRRVTDTNGVLRTNLTATQRALYPGMRNFPYVNPINGDAKSTLTNVQYNSGYDYGAFELYSFGTYSKRVAQANENVRVPTRVSRTVGTVTTYFDPEGDSPVNGFVPREKIEETDYAFTGGVRGDADGFRWDLSTTYGEDKALVYTVNSANASLFADTGFTPTVFYDGFFKNSEFTANADLAKEIDAGMAKPMTIAGGFEYKRNVYQIGSGDAGSIYKEGGQSYPGFRPSDAGVHDRSSVSAYGDVALHPTELLMVDGAVRYEHYSDFGSKVTWKVTSRYDFDDAFAVRGTISTGFRAPTLAESFYSATNVSPTAAFVQLPANSAAAKLLGFTDLKPERSTNYSLGVVVRPASRLTITLDAYQVAIKDRILGTGSLFSAGGGTNATGQSLNFPIVQTAIVANGNVLDPTVTQTGVNIFTNGADTRTRGVDLTISYPTDFGDAGRVNWTLSGNYNTTKITKLGAAPPLRNNVGVLVSQDVFNLSAQSNIETASPKVKMVGSAFWTRNALSVTARGTVYGKSSSQYSPDGARFFKQTIGTALIADLEVNYDLGGGLEVSVGANNLFDKRPPTTPLVPGTTDFTTVNGGNVLDAPLTFSPYGINGGYYYGRIAFKF